MDYHETSNILLLNSLVTFRRAEKPQTDTEHSTSSILFLQKPNGNQQARLTRNILSWLSIIRWLHTSWRKQIVGALTFCPTPHYTEIVKKSEAEVRQILGDLFTLE